MIHDENLLFPWRINYAYRASLVSNVHTQGLYTAWGGRGGGRWNQAVVSCHPLTQWHDNVLVCSSSGLCDLLAVSLINKVSNYVTTSKYVLCELCLCYVLKGQFGYAGFDSFVWTEELSSCYVRGKRATVTCRHFANIRIVAKIFFQFVPLLN